MKKYEDQYDVKGYFYKKNTHPYRKLLDIKHITSNKSTPDLMVIMMNPGSSEQKKGFSNKYDMLVPTIYDPTQNRIIDIMIEYNFEYARILNLSDFVDAESENLYKFLGKNKNDDSHSIFSDNRRSELDSIFIHNIPIIKAWGVKPCLNPFADMALKYIKKNNKAFGLAHNKYDWAYYHPMRHCNKYHENSWVVDIKKTNQKQFNLKY